MDNHKIPTRRDAMYNNCENCKHWQGDKRRPDHEYPWLRRCDIKRGLPAVCWNTAADATCNLYEQK